MFEVTSCYFPIDFTPVSPCLLSSTADENRKDGSDHVVSSSSSADDVPACLPLEGPVFILWRKPAVLPLFRHDLWFCVTQAQPWKAEKPCDKTNIFHIYLNRLGSYWIFWFAVTWQIRFLMEFQSIWKICSTWADTLALLSFNSCVPIDSSSLLTTPTASPKRSWLWRWGMFSLGRQGLLRWGRRLHSLVFLSATVVNFLAFDWGMWFPAVFVAPHRREARLRCSECKVRLAADSGEQSPLTCVV